MQAVYIQCNGVRICKTQMKCCKSTLSVQLRLTYVQVLSFYLQLLLEDGLHPPLNSVQVLSRGDIVFPAGLSTRKC